MSTTFFQPSALPDYKMEMSSECQQSHGYLDNSGKLKLGHAQYEFQQQFLSQDSRELQDLTLKFALKNMNTEAEYKLEYVQKVTWYILQIHTVFSTLTGFFQQNNNHE